MNPASRLREVISQGELIVAPGAFDCITAKTVERAGFTAVYMTGMGTSASRVGLPDYGLATMSEMVANASAMTSVIQTPVIADADTGYGNELNMVRTVREYERHGVAGIHIEDQVFPKKCGHLDKKEIISQKDFVSKLRAAVGARQNQDFLIIARTDANSVAGFNEAIDRANAGLEAGADMALVEAPETLEQLRQIPRLVGGPCVLNILVGGKSPLLSLREVAKLGYKIALLSDLLLGSAIAAYQKALDLAFHGRDLSGLERSLSVREIFNLLDSEQWDNVREGHPAEKNGNGFSNMPVAKSAAWLSHHRNS